MLIPNNPPLFPHVTYCFYISVLASLPHRARMGFSPKLCPFFFGEAWLVTILHPLSSYSAPDLHPIFLRPVSSVLLASLCSGAVSPRPRAYVGRGDRLCSALARGSGRDSREQPGLGLGVRPRRCASRCPEQGSYLERLNGSARGEARRGFIATAI